MLCWFIHCFPVVGGDLLILISRFPAVGGGNGFDVAFISYGGEMLLNFCHNLAHLIGKIHGVLYRYSLDKQRLRIQ